jgi:hypothetical protein
MESKTRMRGCQDEAGARAGPDQRFWPDVVPLMDRHAAVNPDRKPVLLFCIEPELPMGALAGGEALLSKSEPLVSAAASSRATES